MAEGNLMREFEEFEGLGVQGTEELEVNDNEDDDDPTFKPINASSLSSSDIYYEMEKRGIKTTGFPDTDRERLQAAFDEDFKKDLEHEKARRREIRRRAAQQEGIMKRRLLMERTLQEEQDELARNHQTSMMIDFIKENLVSGSIRMDINSVSARSLAKAMWINTTITCLDLSSNELNDRGGIYIARILKRNKTLKKIELDNNPLGPKTCQAFGESLKLNKSLVYLSLDSANLCGPTLNDSNGIKCLSDAIRCNNTLTSLNLWRTGIQSSAGAELASAIEENNSLLFCDMNHNGIDMCEVKRIAEKLETNLADYEARERQRRIDGVSAEDRAAIEASKVEAKRKEEEVAKWLEEKRSERAQSRRAKEEERIAWMQAEAEEKRRLVEADKEAARKAAEEAAAKKSKKKEGGKKK